jgi:glutathione S-transferase
MRLHWSPRSPFVRKVLVCCHELGLIERITLVRSPALMTSVNETLSGDNPLNKLPTLVLDDGAALFDSRVICEYLDKVAVRPHLFPHDLSSRISALRDQALGDGLMDLSVLWRNERDRPSDKQSQPHLTAFSGKLARTLDVLDGEASRLGETTFSIGHIAIACALGYLDFRFSELTWREGRPALAAWMKETEQRPSFIATTPTP